MTVTYDGNVGIGTTTPAAKLHVVQTAWDENTFFMDNTGVSAANAGVGVALRNDDGAAMGSGHRLGIISFRAAEDASNTIATGSYIESFATTGWGASVNDADLRFSTVKGTTAGERMVIDEDGNVGIGTAAPTEELHIKASAPVLKWEGTHANIVGNFTVGLSDPIGTAGVTNSGWSISSDSTDRGFFFREDGNVGIGTTSPESLLHASFASGQNGITVSTPDGASIAQLNLSNGDRGWLLYTDGSSGDMFRIRDSTAAATRLSIDSSGYFGIGTTAPKGRLDVRNDVDSTYSVYLTNQDDTSSANGAVQLDAYLARTGTAGAFTGTSIKSGKEQTWTANSATIDGYLSFSVIENQVLAEYMRISSAGDICDQGQDVDLSDCASDIKLKTNIKDYEYGLNEILALKPVRFNWNEKAEEIGYDPELKVVGLIAQDVEEVIPEWIETNNEGYKKIPGSGNLQYVFINAIQEQQQIIEAQEERIKALETKI
tara:strand:- start:236 stop:1699 length:1464 start_codon:yes stop_codon:yes gene_type:complete